MNQNLILIAGLSHSGKDLLFNHLMKLGRTEADLKIYQNMIYYDWLKIPPKTKEELYIAKLIPPVREKIFEKTNTLIYIHDISYQRLDDAISDFQKIASNVSKYNKNYQVILVLNRGHLIPNEIERNNIRKDVMNRFQQIYPSEIPSYVVSLKGPDEQRRTNLIFTQIIHKAFDFVKELKKPQIGLDRGKINNIQKILQDKMATIGFSGSFVISPGHEVLVAVGKSRGWEEKLGPQIVRMLAQNGAFNLAPKVKTSIVRIEDFLMITQALNSQKLKVVLIGRESAFSLNNESYSTIELTCSELANSISAKL
ncbi:MAG: hypothetical protein ACW964_18070 [Candidatus Hodarchaeales archaeon]